MERLLAAAHGNQDAMDAFARVNNARVMSPEDLLSEENASRILAVAPAAVPR